MPSMVKELAYAAAQQQEDPPACRQFLRGSTSPPPLLTGWKGTSSNWN
jgi:hypothetical protein